MRTEVFIAGIALLAGARDAHAGTTIFVPSDYPAIQQAIVAPVDGDTVLVALDDVVIAMSAPSDFQLKQVLDILRARLTERKIDVRCLDVAEPEINLATARQKVKVKQGIEHSVAKKIVAAIKDAKLKVETQINGDRLRVTDTKKDDLQLAIALLRKTELDVSLQFDNFRD